MAISINIDGCPRGREYGYKVIRRPGEGRASFGQRLMLMVHLFVVMGVAVRQRLVFMIMCMLTLFLIMHVMFILTVRMGVLYRDMSMRLLLHRASLFDKERMFLSKRLFYHVTAFLL